MTKLSGVRCSRQIAPAVCAAWALAAWTLIGLGCWWPVPQVVAEERTSGDPQKESAEKPDAEQTPDTPKTADEKPPITPPPAQVPRQAEEEQNGPAVPPNVLQRLLWKSIFGGDTDDDELGRRKRKHTDPRAPTNQKLSALLKRAQTHFKAGETRQSLELLQRLLEMPDDALYEVSPGNLISIRSAAHRLLAQLPPAELDRYRSEYGGVAKRALAEAKATRSPAALAQVATRYLQTESGTQAANLLAATYLDRGEYGLAAFWLKELLESQAPMTKDPTWRTKAEFVANKIESQVLKKLLARQPALPGEKIVLGGESIDRVTWLSKLAPPAPLSTPVLGDWLQFFGSARRVGQAAAGEPLLLPRWSFPMTYSLAIHHRVQQLMTDLRDADQVPIFTFHPLLVDGKIIFRSLRGVKVVTADTGQLLWETSDEPAVEDVLAASAAHSTGNGDSLQIGQALMGMVPDDLEEVPASDNPLTHLLFRNSNHGLLSSDGKRLFVIEDLSVMTNLQPGQYWGEDLPEVDTLGRPLGINRLTAYDLQTGRSTWEVGGPSLDDPFELPLAGTFFFGAPVVDGRDLFVVTEKEGQIRLQALNAATGKPIWSQLIAHPQAKISMDVGRQWLSAPVAVGDGVIVCPTTVGWIVAVDRSTHGILWAYRYQDLNSASETEPQDEAMQPSELNERWAAAPPVIVGDRVIFTPPEESRIICLSLSDGHQLWSEPRSSALFLAGVFGEEAVIVGEQAIRFINIRQPARRKLVKFPSPDARPAGRGVAVQDRYYLPLTSGELLAINLKTFQLEGTSYLPSSSEPQLNQFGNLGMYRGMLVSLSPQGLVAFEPKLSIESELQKLLTADPQSASAAIRKAELELLQRRYAVAREVLQKVQVSDLTGKLRQRYRATFVTALSALVREDLAARDTEFEELAQLAEEPAELHALEMLRAERLIYRQDHLGAFQVYRRFAETHGTDLVVPQESAHWTVRGRQWAASRLVELQQRAPADLQSKVAPLILEQSVQVLTQDREHQQRFLDLYGSHPATVEVRKKLAETLRLAGEWQAAENQLVKLQSDPLHRIWAIERLAELWQHAGLPADAAYFYQVLERDHATATWDGQKTVSQHIQDLRDAGRLPAAITTPVCDWHNQSLVAVRSGSNFDGSGMIKNFNQQGSGLPFFQQHRLQFVSQEPRFEIVDARSEKKVWSLPVRTSPETITGLAQINVTGHQVILFQGGSVTALSPTERRVLWSHVFDDHAPDEQLEMGFPDIQLPEAMKTLGRKSGVFDGDDASGAQGVTRFGNQHSVCYLARRQLIVLDAVTGEIRWKRSSLPIGTQMLGGTRVIYAWHPVQHTVTAYDIIDGRELTIPGLTALCEKSIGRIGDDFIRVHKTQGTRKDNSTMIQVDRFDPLNQIVRWSLDISRKTLASLIPGDRLILADPQGQLVLCDLETGTTRPCGNIPAASLRGGNQVYAVPTYDQLLIALHRDDKFPNDRFPDTFPALRVAGTIHAFDLVTGQERWKQPVGGLHLILGHLDHSPIVLCLARTFEQTNSSWKLSLLAIDRQHGQIVHQSEFQVQANFDQMSVNMLDGYVELKTYNDRLRLMPKTK